MIKIHTKEGLACYDDIKDWYRSSHIPHCSDGPAVLHDDGTEEWFVDGKRHRLGGPAIISKTVKEWYVNGLRHREDGPAIEFSTLRDGFRVWYYKGKGFTLKEQWELAKAKDGA